MPLAKILITLAFAAWAATATAQDDGLASPTRETAPAADSFRLTAIAEVFRRPLYLTHAGDDSGRLFVVEQGGKIWILENGQRLAQPFLDVSHLISPVALTENYSERGLLGLAFHPEDAAPGRSTASTARAIKRGWRRRLPR